MEEKLCLVEEKVFQMEVVYFLSQESCDLVYKKFFEI